jgi:3-hydroxyacyl-[acyl-carrier-protein] dehydratase
MVMVHTLEEHYENKSTSGMLVEAENIFSKNGIFHEPGLIENIAQTAALQAGYMAKIKDKNVKKGYIGSVKHLKIYHLPKTNETLRTTVTILNQLLNAAIIKGEIRVNDKLVAECEMTIFTIE